MAKLSATIFVVFAAVAQLATAAPLAKRISQDINDSTHEWVQACIKAGGGVACKNVGVNAFSTLLETAGSCAQQDAADMMVDLAKQLFDDKDMIRFAQIFAQQPRNTRREVASPYCQEEPKNDEIKGLYPCQFASAASATFAGVPFGLSAPVSPAGSCPAHPSGPVPDGEQLVHLTQDPGLENRPIEGVAPQLAVGSEVLFTVPRPSTDGTTPALTRMNFCPPSSTSASRTRSSAKWRRVGQDGLAATQPWADACAAAGGPEGACARLAAAAAYALRSDAGACAQQDAADAMVALARTLGGAASAEMVRLARVYVQQPRSTVTGLATPYCQHAPRHDELAGLFKCQFQSAEAQVFAGGLLPGELGTIPYGLDAPVSPAGACAASPRGPVPDGLQLVDLVREACEQ